MSAPGVVQAYTIRPVVRKTILEDDYVGNSQDFAGRGRDQSALAERCIPGTPTRMHDSEVDLILEDEYVGNDP